MSMPLFGAIEDFSKQVDERYNFMNRKCILNVRTIRTLFCTESCTIGSKGVTGDVRRKVIS